MTPIRLVHHAPGAPGLRWFGLGPSLGPTRALLKLQRLFDRHAFWARGRSFSQLRRLLSGSDAVVSLWRGRRLVGFGRATSDGFSRAVLWDIVVAGDLQGHGLGRRASAGASERGGRSGELPCDRAFRRVNVKLGNLDLEGQNFHVLATAKRS